MIQQNVPGEVVIKTVSIFTTRGVVNILEHVRFMSIYESIITPGIMAEVSILDSKDLLTVLPILGNERITIEFSTPGRNNRTYDLQITQIKHSNPAENMRSKSYMLVAFSPEVVQDKSIQVNKSYNTNISFMVPDVIKTYLESKKKVVSQSTKGVQKLLISSMNPFEAIDMMRKRSISINDNSSTFVFFENSDGYNFRTLEDLLNQSDLGDRYFTNDPNLAVDRRLSEFRNIIDYKQDSQFDTIRRLKGGGLSHEVKKFDLKTLTYKTNRSVFDASKFKSADGTMKSPDTIETVDRYSKNYGTQSWVWTDSSQPDTFISEGLGSRSHAGSIYSQGLLYLHVFGDSELTVGRLINANILEASSIIDQPVVHKQISGNFIIAFLRHVINVEGHNPRYTCAIEAIKGSYKDEL